MTLCRKCGFHHKSSECPPKEEVMTEVECAECGSSFWLANDALPFMNVPRSFCLKCGAKCKLRVKEKG